MVNNSTNINNTNKQLPLTSKHWLPRYDWNIVETGIKHPNLNPIQAIEHKRPWHMTLEIQVLAWDRHTNMAGLIWLMGSEPSPS